MKFKISILLISINIGLYVLWQTTGFYKGALWIWRGVPSPYWRTITYGFLHNNLRHLVLNMLTLIVFLPIFEYKYGGSKTLFIYVATSTIAGFLFLNFEESNYIITRGASAAAYGIVTALIIGLLSKEEVNIILLIMAITFLIFGFYDTYTGANVNEIGHWGGALAGFVLMFIMTRTYKKSPQ